MLKIAMMKKNNLSQIKITHTFMVSVIILTLLSN